jgi:hypothetical protein
MTQIDADEGLGWLLFARGRKRIDDGRSEIGVAG